MKGGHTKEPKFLFDLRDSNGAPLDPACWGLWARLWHLDNDNDRQLLVSDAQLAAEMGISRRRVKRLREMLAQAGALSSITHRHGFLVTLFSEPNQVSRNDSPQVQRNGTPEVQQNDAPEVQQNDAPEVQQNGTPHERSGATPGATPGVPKPSTSIGVCKRNARAFSETETETEERARDPQERLAEDAAIMAGATVPSDHRSTVADGIGNAGEGNGVESLADRLIAATMRLLRPGERSAVNASPAELVTRRLSERLGGFDLPPEKIGHALVWASRTIRDEWLQARALNWQALSGGKRGDVDVLDQVLLQWRQAGCPIERDDTAPDPEPVIAASSRNGNRSLAGLIDQIGHGRTDA